jgi:hypothetical protein
MSASRPTCVKGAVSGHDGFRGGPERRPLAFEKRPSKEFPRESLSLVAEIASAGATMVTAFKVARGGPHGIESSAGRDSKFARVRGCRVEGPRGSSAERPSLCSRCTTSWHVDC